MFNLLHDLTKWYSTPWGGHRCQVSLHVPGIVGLAWSADSHSDQRLISLCFQHATVCRLSSSKDMWRHILTSTTSKHLGNLSRTDTVVQEQITYYCGWCSNRETLLRVMTPSRKHQDLQFLMSCFTGYLGEQILSNTRVSTLSIPTSLLYPPVFNTMRKHEMSTNIGSTKIKPNIPRWGQGNISVEYNSYDQSSETN